MNNNAQLKCTWTAGLVWSAITLAVSIAVRVALWFMLVYNDVETFPNDEMLMPTLLPLLFPALLVVGMYLIMYRGYMNIAAKHPSQLRGVAHDQYGKPFIAPLLLVLILEVVWLFVSALFLVLGVNMGFSFFYNDSARAIITALLIMHGVGLVMDLVLYLVGYRFAKPDLVQRSY